MKSTIVGKIGKCCRCNKTIFLPPSLFRLKLALCVCKECREKEVSTTPAKYLSDEWGELEVTRYRAVVQEKEMNVVCSKCNASHAVSPVIFIDCTFRFPDGSYQRYESGFIVPPKKYWCPLS